MKTSIRVFTAMTAMLLLFFSNQILAQNAATTPQFITVTIMHWNLDYEDFDLDTWKSVEKEYLEKVTQRNEHILSSSFYIHNLTPDNTEIAYVKAYGTWADIDMAAERDSELEREAWSDESSRKAFLKKQKAYYSNAHSDNIYSVFSSLVKPLPDWSKDMVCYVRKTHFAYPEDVEDDELQNLYTENVDKLFKANPLVKGYYPHRHAWGADGTEMLEAFYFESLADLENMFDGLPELSQKAWPDEAARKTRNKALSKYFTGVHGDYIYTLVGGLSK